MSRKSKTIITLVVLLMVAAVATYLIVRSATAGTLVATATATSSDMDVTVTASGKVVPDVSGNVYPGTSGTLAEVYVSDGATVTAGAKLALIDPAPLKAAVDQASAAVAQAKSARSSLGVSAPSSQQAAADAALTSAQSAYALAVTNLSRATITAPIAGTVFFNVLGTQNAAGSFPKAAVGVVVGPQAAPFTIVNLDAQVFSAEVDEADIDRIREGMNASVSLDSFPGASFETTVSKTGLAAQPTATGGTVFAVNLPLKATGKKILIGMKGNAQIKVSSVKNALTVPIEALFSESGNDFVYVIESSKLKKTNVTLGATTDARAEVLSGITAGTVVALPTGSTQFTDGMTVRVK